MAYRRTPCRLNGKLIEDCCEYIKNRQGILTNCGARANYRKSWHYCPYCGRPIAVLFNDDHERAI